MEDKLLEDAGSQKSAHAPRNLASLVQRHGMAGLNQGQRESAADLPLLLSAKANQIEVLALASKSLSRLMRKIKYSTELHGREPKANFIENVCYSAISLDSDLHRIPYFALYMAD